MPEEKKWITVNGTPIPLDENGNLQGKVGSKIKHETEVAEKVKKAINALERIQAGEEEVTIPSLRNDLEQYGGTNDITFMKGDGGKGVTHLIENGRGEYLADIFTAVAAGNIADYVEKDKKVILENDNIAAVLKLHYDGKKKSWLLTGYDKNTSSKKERKTYQRQKPVSDGQGKGFSRHLPTQTEPRSFRLCLVADSGFKKILANSMKKSSMNKRTVIFDSKSKRSFDINGFMHVDLSNLTKESVDPYWGYEIVNSEALGLEQDKLYYGYRKGEELKKAAQTFNGLPLMRDHHFDSAEKPQREHRVGSVGTDCVYNAPYLQASLTITDAEAIRKIESGERVELSCSYFYTAVLEKGEFGSQPYDFVMTDIQGNHVALVGEGRAGADVRVADSGENVKETQENITYNPEKKDEKMAQPEEKKEEIIQDEENKEKTCDSELPEEKKELVQDDDFEIEEILQAAGIAPSDEVKKAFLAGMHFSRKKDEAKEAAVLDSEVSGEAKGAAQTEPKPAPQADPKPAMDANTIKRQIREEMKDVQLAVRDVLPLVGKLDIVAYDSADQVYLKACQLLGVSATKTTARDVCRALLSTAGTRQPVMAMDSGMHGFRSRFDNN